MSAHASALIRALLLVFADHSTSPEASNALICPDSEPAITASASPPARRPLVTAVIFGAAAGRLPWTVASARYTRASSTSAGWRISRMCLARWLIGAVQIAFTLLPQRCVPLSAKTSPRSRVSLTKPSLETCTRRLSICQISFIALQSRSSTSLTKVSSASSSVIVGVTPGAH